LKDAAEYQYNVVESARNAEGALEVPMRLFLFLAVLTGLFSLHGAALAQNVPSPRVLQGMIADGQDQAALDQLQSVLQVHPHSGIAWYLTAEAQDALGHEDAARSALAKAEQFAPGLPFAKPDDVAALQAHLQTVGGDAPAHGGISAMVVIGLLVVLFLLVRVFLRARRRVVPAYDAYGRPMGYGPGGPGYAPPGYGAPGYSEGPGIGGSLLGGLAAGAGFAAGERIIEDIEGDRGQGYVDPNIGGGGFDQVPDRDDGLQGDPGWDDGSGGGGSNDGW
jgi:hypothetical protein